MKTTQYLSGFYGSSIILLLILIQFSCKKELLKGNPDDSSPAQTSKLNIIWNKYFYSDSSLASFNTPQFADDYIVVCTYMSSSGQELGAKVFNKITGELHQSWLSDPIHTTHQVSLHNDVICGPNNNVIAMTDRTKLIAMDINSGQVKWTHNFLPINGLTVCTTLGDDIIQTFGTWMTTDRWSAIGRFNYENGSMDSILTIYANDDYDFHINAPSVYVTFSQDTILYFSTSCVNFYTLDERIDAYAYNMSKDTMLWKMDDISENVFAMSKFPPLIAEKKVIFHTGTSIHCFDIETGVLVWERTYPQATERFSLNPFAYYEGRVFVRSGTKAPIRAFEMSTGKLIWESHHDIDIIGGGFDFYNKNIYFTASYPIDNGLNMAYGLVCINTIGGKLMWKEKGVGAGIVIDQATGYLYGTGANNVMCIDLNNTKK